MPGGRRIFEVQRRLGMDQRIGRARRDGGLGEAGRGSASACRDRSTTSPMAKMPALLVAHGRGVDGDLVVLQRRGPTSAIGPERHRQAEERAAARRPRCALLAPSSVATVTAVSWPSAPSRRCELIGHHEIDLATALASALSRASLSGAARNLSRRWITDDACRDLGQRQRPVDRAVSPPPAITTRLPRKSSRCVT